MKYKSFKKHGYCSQFQVYIIKNKIFYKTKEVKYTYHMYINSVEHNEFKYLEKDQRFHLKYK